MIAFDLGSIEAASKLLENVKLCSLGESLGGVETLISHPASMTHASVPKDQRDLPRHHRRPGPHLRRHRRH